MGKTGRSSLFLTKKYRPLFIVGGILLLFCALSQPAFAGVTEVTPLTTGSFSANIKDMVEGGEYRKVKVPIPFYLIRHSEKGIILFDSGLGIRFESQVKGSLINRLLQLLLPYQLKEEETAVRQLQKIGIQPGEVKTIIVSHLHYDHAGGLRDFPWATIVVSQEEWDFANSGGIGSGILRRLRGYIKEQCRCLEDRIGLVNYSSLSEWGPFEASYDLLGDGSILLISTSGHTPGHQSALITLDDGRKVFLTGDAVWLKENFERPAPKGRLFRKLFEDEDKAWETTLRIRQFSDENPDILIFPGHDPDFQLEPPSITVPNKN